MFLLEMCPRIFTSEWYQSRLNCFNLHCTYHFFIINVFIFSLFGGFFKKNDIQTTLHTQFPTPTYPARITHQLPNPNPSSRSCYFLLLLYTDSQRKLHINLKIRILFSCVKNNILLACYPCSSHIALTTQNIIHINYYTVYLCTAE